MPLVAFSSPTIPCTKPPLQTYYGLNNGRNRYNPVTNCGSQEPSQSSGPSLPAKNPKLGVGSPIVFIESPKTIKTATAMPCLRVNTGLVKPGDVGRIVSRKPKDLWAVRLAIGTYLIDGKYFRPLELSE